MGFVLGCSCLILLTSSLGYAQPLSVLQVVLRLRRPGASTWPITRALRAVAAWPLSQARRLGFLFVQGMVARAAISLHDCRILQSGAEETNLSTS